MDTDHGKDIDVDPVPITLRQMKINTFAYDGQFAGKPTSFYCGATIFSYGWPDPITERPIGDTCDMAECNDKRDVASNTTLPSRPWPRSQKSAEQLIVNSRPQQSAIELCNSPMSRGADFVSTAEGLFCDMDTKTLYPICSAGVAADLDCFDIDSKEPHLRTAFERKLGRRASKWRRYKKVSHWD